MAGCLSWWVSLLMPDGFEFGFGVFKGFKGSRASVGTTVMRFYWEEWMFIVRTMKYSCKCERRLVWQRNWLKDLKNRECLWSSEKKRETIDIWAFKNNRRLTWGRWRRRWMRLPVIWVSTSGLPRIVFGGWIVGFTAINDGVLGRRRDRL